MKKIILIAVLIYSCEAPKRARKITINDLKPPVVVVSTGSFLTDCTVMYVDGEGRVFKEINNYGCSLKRGDTLIHTKK